MAKFVTTTGISHHLEELIRDAKEKLYLISPFLKINERLKTRLHDKDLMKLDIRVIYGKNELKPDQIKWLQDRQSIRTSYCQNLHAKCYLNESTALITSMNLYEYSQVHNEEMGILVTLAEDPVLYSDVLEDARRLIRQSDEVRINVERVPKTDRKNNGSAKKSAAAKKTKARTKQEGHCIRCSTSVKADPSHPYCDKCYKSWRRYENPEYKEKVCHTCGEALATSMAKPQCYSCYRKSA